MYLYFKNVMIVLAFAFSPLKYTHERNTYEGKKNYCI